MSPHTQPPSRPASGPPRSRRRIALAAGLGCALLVPATASTATANEGDRLIGRAVLDGATFADGPTSGQFIDDLGPFVDAQPVQGFSSVLPIGDGTYWGMSDNGFGGITNSADYNLRIYRLAPTFEVAFDEANPPAPNTVGDGSVDVLEHIELRDPDHQVPFAIVNHFSEERVLTGADFDIESLQIAADGTLWIGDEFGPFLIHTDATGKVLQPPVSLPDPDGEGLLTAPQNPYNEEISTLRVMNAVRAHAEANGNTKTPVVSPWEVMLDDGDPTTAVPDRDNPTDGLAAASSEIHDVAELQAAGFPVVPYTINDADRMVELLELGVDGIITDRPDLLRDAIETFDPTIFTDDGRIDPARLDAQGHRGARNLRPENTLPAMEVALDLLMNTLETDTGVSLDGVSMIDHDPAIESGKCRRADGSPYTDDDEVPIKDLTAAEIQERFVCDGLIRGPEQVNDLDLSPVSVAFAADAGIDPYAMPTVQNLFDFTDFYVEYYTTGAGSGDDGAAVRAANAAEVRFNIETKRNPGVDFVDRTVDSQAFVDALAGAITANGVEERASIQSFDWSTLILTQEQFPSIQTVYLFGDFTGDGTNLADENGENTPWLAGLYWPYRTTTLSNPFLVRGSGGFEGMALSPDGRTLYPMLERELSGERGDGTLLISEFSTRSGEYTGTTWDYPLDERAGAIGEFQLFNRVQGVVIERDGSQGDLDGYKVIKEVRLNGDGTVTTVETVDLLSLSDRFGISLPGDPGDVGLGDPFAFPFVTIESVVVLNSQTLLVANDNNYPFSVGRQVGSGDPDDNEFIVIRLDDRLGTLTRLR